MVKRSRTLKVKIPAGVDTGSRLRLTAEGEIGLRGGPPGDLFVYIHVQPHATFKREGNNVIVDADIDFAQAALGDEITVPTLEGKAKLKVPEGTQSGTVLRMKQKGIPDVRGYGRGDQHVRIRVVTPTRLTGKQKDLLQEFGRIESQKPHSGEKGFFEKVRDAFSG
jgi:molecular chaperone DnaJ